MKRLIPFLFVIATCVGWVHGQQYALKSPSVNSVIESRGYIMQFAPPAMAAYVNAGAGWVPLTGTGSTGQLPFSPPAAALYVLNGSNAWIPWTGAGGGGGTGTVTSFSCVTANGVSCSVATATTTPAATFTLGAITPTSMLATGNMDGTAPVTITTGTTATLNAFLTGYWFNQEATAATAVAYTLPTAAAGLQKCVGNSWNGSAATTGVLTVNTSASGQFIIFTDGTLSATGGNVTSGGAAADFACFIGVDSTHWYFKPSSGTWTKH